MNSSKRKLAAIMFTDIVGYSALSHRDEELAMALLEEHRAIIRPLLALHEGKEIRTIGDAFFLEFTSAVHAVHFALAAQLALRTRNQVEPPSRRVMIRIGLHLGDVMVAEDGDRFGDGVNIAARLQTLAKPGGICFSGQVYDQVHNKIDHTIHFVGGRKLKNIKKIVKVFRVDLEPSEISHKERISDGLRRVFGRRRWNALASSVATALILSIGAFHWQPTKEQNEEPTSKAPARHRIAILPFLNLSAQNDDSYLSDGMTEELISQLSRIPDLRVLGRATVQKYKDRTQDVANVGHELGVATVLTGSVRRSGEELRITVQMTDTKNGENVWSQSFDSRLEGILATQRTIAERVCTHFQSNPNRLPAAAPQASIESQREAYLLYLKGKYFLHLRTEAALTTASDYFRRAVELSPTLSEARVGMANASGLLGFYGYLSPLIALQQGQKYAAEVLMGGSNSAEALVLRAMIAQYYSRDWAQVDSDFKRALEISPSYAAGHQWYGEFLLARGRNAEARISLARALELDPLSLVTQVAQGFPAYYEGDYSTAIRQFEIALEMDRNFLPANLWLGRTLIAAGKYARAIETLQRALELSAGSSLIKAALAQAHARRGSKSKAEGILAELIETGKTRYVSSYDLAGILLALGRSQEALEAVRRAASERAYYSVYFRVDPLMSELRNTPGYAVALRELNLGSNSSPNRITASEAGN